jgi:hypothetical protein
MMRLDKLYLPISFFYQTNSFPLYHFGSSPTHQVQAEAQGEEAASAGAWAAKMDGNHSPLAQLERDGSFNYDIESTDGGPREPLLRKRATNTTSQIAIIGANVSPIESLDYEYVAPNPFLFPLSSVGIVAFSRAMRVDSRFLKKFS